MPTNPQDIEGRTYQPVLLRGGLDLIASKYDVRAGTLQDGINYEASEEGYTRSQGLLKYDGTYDSAIEDMWYVGTTYGGGGESSYTGDGFTLGGRATWGTDNSGTVVYWKTTAAAPDYAELGLVEITGDIPAVNNVITDSTNGTTLTLGATLAYPPATLTNGAKNPSTGALIADTISKYLAYLNTTVNTALTGQSDVAGSLSHHGEVPGRGGITGGFQFQDNVYAVRDYYGIGFDNGGIEFLVGHNIAIEIASNGKTVVGTVASITLTAGAWADGNAAGYFVLQPQANSSTAWADSTAYALHALVSHNSVEYVCVLAHTSSAATNEPVSGSSWETNWHINDITNLDNAASSDDIFIAGSTDLSADVNTSNTLNKGGLWKATTAGWVAVDMGYTIDFTDGENAPSVRDAPLFVSNMLSVVKDDGAKAWTSPTETGSAPYIAWSNIANSAASDDSRATSNLLVNENTRTLIGTVSTASIQRPDSRILGIEVAVEARQSGTGVPYDTVVQLANVKSGATWYLSDNRAKFSALPAADATVTYGTSSDLWGIEEISAQDIIDGHIQVRVQYTNAAVATGQVEIDSVLTTVHYVPQAQHVYVYDGSADVTEADITAYQVTNNQYTWQAAPPNPAGIFTLYNIDTAVNIKVGFDLYTGASGSGDKIATINSAPRYNLLPSEAEMTAAGSMYETIVANFFTDEGSEAVYGATGASSAFSYTGDFFSFIRTPLLEVADKPRHVEFDINMLALGYPTGHVLLSSVGAPHDFSGVAGGTSWGFRDPITGLKATPGSTLAVFARSSIGTLTGTDPSSITQKNVQSTSGAQEYTMQNIIEPFFADFHGIGNISTTQRFGDFKFGRVSAPVTPWLQDRLQNRLSIETHDQRPVAGVQVRNKNQYRLYFKDGYILTASFFERSAAEFTWQHYDTANYSTNYVPTFLDSTVLSNGRERIIMGTGDGSIWVVDGANSIQTGSGFTEMDAYITLNPINLDRPEAVAKYYHVVLQGQFYGWQQVEAWGDTNYVFDATGPAHDTVNVGSSSDAAILESVNNLDSVYLPMLADGFSVKLQTSVDGSKPHTLQSLIVRASIKGTDRTRTIKDY